MIARRRGIRTGDHTLLVLMVASLLVLAPVLAGVIGHG